MEGTQSISTKNYLDHFVVYRSLDEPDKFVAHSIRTDQVGVSDDIEDAIYELFHAIHVLLEEAKHDSSVAIQHLAPSHVIELFLKKAQPLPEPILRRIQERFRRSASHRALEWKPDSADDEDDEAELGKDDSFFGNVCLPEVEAVGAA